MDNKNSYSILMTVYIKDEPLCLRESIESMLGQTLAPSEFVIVKDGPLTAELDEVLEEYVAGYPDMIKVYALEKNMGLGLALKAGMEHCTCDIIARMDSDDISLPERCEVQMEYLASHPDVDFVGSVTYEFTGDIQNIRSKRMVPETNEEIVKFAKKRNPFVHPSLMLRRSAVSKVGGYDDMPYAEDYDLISRLIQGGHKSYNFQRPLVYMRVSEDFYGRRGGGKYLKHMLRFNRILYKRKFYSLYDLIYRSAVQMIVCSIPNGIREFIYVKLLRK